MKKLIDFIQNNYKNFEVTVEENKDTTVITMKKINKEEITKKIKEFEEYVKQIDDDFFIDICDVFNALSDKNTSGLSKLIEEASDLEQITKYTDLFKYVTKQFIKEHIIKLQNKYLKQN